MKNSRTIYKLLVDDLQYVSMEVLGRNLVSKEIKMLEAEIPERLPWYQIIEDIINEKILVEDGNNINS